MGLRLVAIATLVCASAGSASADKKPDKKLEELATGYQRESTTCATQAGGIGKVADGAATLAAATPDDTALADAVAKLQAGRAIVDDYCAELTAVLQVIAADPAATYRSLERDLDARDNKIRRARAASKKALDGLAPVLHDMIPRINARVGPAATDKRPSMKFPSGHVVELPSLPGQWRLSGSATTDTADYTDTTGGKTITASVWTHAFTGATCDQQRRMLPAADPKAPKEGPSERAPSEAAKALGVAWSATYVKRAAPARVVIVTCLPGGWMATAELQPVEPAPTPALLDDMAELMTRMLAAASAVQ